MKYDKCKCDGCEREFCEDDDIVVCPECGTPQHRECYQLKNECVNASKHGEGFVWAGEVTPAEPEEAANEEKPLVCPTCGFENEPGSNKCVQCGMKFTMFGINVVEKQQELEQEEQNTRQNHDSAIHEITDTDSLIDARVHILAPGITQEQKREPLCGHTIRETIGFVGRGADSYVKKFRKIERERKRTFNWAAFFFTPFWFFFRKLYKHGIVFLTIDLAITLLSFAPAAKMQEFITSIDREALLAMTQEQFSQYYQNYMTLAVPVLIFGFIRLVAAIIAGVVADKAYHSYCEKSLFEVDALKSDPSNEDDDLGLFIKRSSTSLIMLVIAGFISTILPSILISFFTT